MLVFAIITQPYSFRNLTKYYVYLVHHYNCCTIIYFTILVDCDATTPFLPSSSSPHLVPDAMFLLHMPMPRKNACVEV